MPPPLRGRSRVAFPELLTTDGQLQTFQVVVYESRTVRRVHPAGFWSVARTSWMRRSFRPARDVVTVDFGAKNRAAASPRVLWGKPGATVDAIPTTTTRCRTASCAENTSSVRPDGRTC
jgi:hypothetical protein